MIVLAFLIAMVAAGVAVIVLLGVGIIAIMEAVYQLHEWEEREKKKDDSDSMHE